MSRILISAAHKSSGKTTLSLGLCATFVRRGLKVQAFKKGPDYIDPLWLSKASSQPCYNLDFNTASVAEIQQLFQSKANSADITLIEGNKGLHDGMAIDGSNSNAALAQHLQAPVILVLDTRGMTRGVAPLVRGFAEFDDSLYIGGVILNQVGGPRHESKLRQAIETYTDIPVLGAVRASPDVHILERHLGLIPGNEQDSAQATIARIADAVSDQVDLAALLEIAAAAPAQRRILARETAVSDPVSLRIGVAKDSAFGFYYADDLEALESRGAELVFFSPLTDASLPNVDALFLGGGFPETHADALAGNTSMLEQVRNAVHGGLPVYAECGGLIYLSRSLHWRDQNWDMAGVVPGDVFMHDKPQGRGYAVVSASDSHPWNPGPVLPPVSAHEFHYSAIQGLPENSTFAWQVRRGRGIDGQHDGYISRNLLASYVHLRNTSDFRWTDHFIDFIQLNRPGMGT